VVKSVIFNNESFINDYVLYSLPLSCLKSLVDLCCELDLFETIAQNGRLNQTKTYLKTYNFLKFNIQLQIPKLID